MHLRRGTRNKRAQMGIDLVTSIIVLVIVFGIAILIGYKIINSININIQAHADIPARGKTAFNEVESMFPGVIDNSFLLFFVGLCIVAMAAAMAVRVHPIFFVFYIIIFVIIIVISAAFSNFYLEIANHPEFYALAENLTFTTRLVSIAPWITGVFGMLIAAIMYRNYQEASF